jgi:MATE family multidrug resistance protein
MTCAYDHLDPEKLPPGMSSRSQLVTETRELFKLAAPLFIAQLAQMGTGVVDTIMAGRYSSVDLAAIAIGYNLWLPVYLVSLGIMLAVTSIAAQHYGGGRIAKIQALLPQAIWVALVLGLVSVPLCYFPGPVLELLSLDEETFSRAEGYLKAVAFGIGFFANIPLNYAFIYGHWGVPEMGAPGCGWATAISMWLGPVLIAFYTTRSKALRPYLPEARWYWPERRAVGEILHVGAPIGATFFFEMAVFSVIGLLIASVGNTAISAHQIAINVYDVLYMPLISIGSAMATRIGHGIGRVDMPAVKNSLVCGFGISVLFCIVITIVLLLIPDPVARIYTEDNAIRDLAVALLRLAVLFVVIDMFAVVTSFALRAFKDTRFPFLVMTIAYWMVALPLGYHLGLSDEGSDLHGAVGFWWAMIVGVAIAVLLEAWRLSGWLKRPLTPDPDYNEDNPDSFAA